MLGKREGNKLSYITDTRPIDEIVGFIEGNFCMRRNLWRQWRYRKGIENKNDFREAAELAFKGKVDRLAHHFSPAMEDPNTYIKHAKTIFENTIIGYDGYTEVLSYE